MTQAKQSAEVRREAALLELGAATHLPSDVGEREDGFYLGLIEVHDGEPMLLTMNGQMKPAETDAFLRRVQK